MVPGFRVCSVSEIVYTTYHPYTMHSVLYTMCYIRYQTSCILYTSEYGVHSICYIAFPVSYIVQGLWSMLHTP